MRVNISHLLPVGLLAAFTSVVNAVTLTTASGSYTVDAQASNAFVVVFSRTNCDITSLKYRGTEVQYQGGMKSHIGSGLGSGTSVSAQTLNSGGTNYVKVTCQQGTLTHYYVIRDGDSSLHMGTYITAQTSIGELRWIGRFNPGPLPNDDVNGASSTGGSSSAVEGSDVFIVNGQTRSKFYSSQRFIDDKVHCLSGNDMKACMVMPGNAYETSSGGPFHRDIDTNPSGDYNALYLYMNSGHVQTENIRLGFYGPYSCVFSRSGTPSPTTDLSFMGNLGLSGFVGTSSRGYVSGRASGVDSKYQTVLHWYNSAAQYWTYADGSGNFNSPAMKTGSYTMVLYQNELKVAESSVSVSAGNTVSKNIASTWSLPSNTIFQIGDWDGQPFGFRNADKFLRMHPSDSRMSSWGPSTYTVGQSSVGDFPMAVFKSVNSPITIKFNVPASQAGAATLRIGTTLSFAGGRPSVVVNGAGTTNPAAPTKIDSRGVTRGAYRGFGEIYNYAISNLVSGTNTIEISALSGSSGDAFLSPNVIFDAVHLFSPNSNNGGTPTTTTRAATTTQGSNPQTTTTPAVVTTTSSSGGSGGVSPVYGQCGGSGWTGPTQCASGSTCTYSNDWYSQCLP